MGHVTRTNKSCRAYKRVRPHVWMSHIIRVKCIIGMAFNINTRTSAHQRVMAHKRRVMAHICVRLVTHVICHTCEFLQMCARKHIRGVMAHICVSHVWIVTHAKLSSRVWTSRVIQVMTTSHLWTSLVIQVCIYIYSYIYICMTRLVQMRSCHDLRSCQVAYERVASYKWMSHVTCMKASSTRHSLIPAVCRHESCHMSENP